MDLSDIGLVPGAGVDEADGGEAIACGGEGAGPGAAYAYHVRGGFVRGVVFLGKLEAGAVDCGGPLVASGVVGIEFDV